MYPQSPNCGLGLQNLAAIGWPSQVEIIKNCLYDTPISRYFSERNIINSCNKEEFLKPFQKNHHPLFQVDRAVSKKQLNV